MKLGWVDRATGGKNQDGSRMGMATVAALVWPFLVWVCDGNRWQREAWGMVAAWGVRRERWHEPVNGGMSFFFTVSVSPLSLASLFFLFSFVFGFRLFRLFLLLGFQFFFFTFFFLDLHGLMGSWLGQPAGIGGPSHFDKGGQVLYFFVFWKTLPTKKNFFLDPGGAQAPLGPFLGPSLPTPMKITTKRWSEISFIYTYEPVTCKTWIAKLWDTKLPSRHTWEKQILWKDSVKILTSWT